MKKIVKLMASIGIKILNPAFSSPLFTSPITKLEIKLVIIINKTEK